MKVGGAFVAEGTDTCIVTPNIMCPGGRPSDPSKVSRIVLNQLIGQELEIHIELRKNPVYRQFLRGGAKHALESITVGYCSASAFDAGRDLAPSPSGKVHVPDRPCSRINDGNKEKYLNLITDIVNEENLGDVLLQRPELLGIVSKVFIDNTNDEKGAFIGILYRNVLDFLETTHAQDKSVIHGDFHIKNAFIKNNSPENLYSDGDPVPIVYMHDFGRGMLFDKNAYNPKMMHDHETVKYARRYSELIPKLESRIESVARQFPLFAGSNNYPQLSLPLIILWNVYALFAEVQIDVLNGKPVPLHNDVVTEITALFTNMGRIGLHANSYIPPANLNSPYIRALCNCLKSPNPFQDFTNVFDIPGPHADFPMFKYFLNGCLKYVDILAICNNAMEIYKRILKKIRKTTLSMDILRQKVNRVYDTIHNLAEPGVVLDANTLPDVVQISTIRKIFLRDIFVPTTSTQIYYKLGGKRRTFKKRRGTKKTMRNLVHRPASKVPN
jgi:hypothetical protein